MGRLRSYLVHGTFKKHKIEIIEEAFSPRQAKLKSAFDLGISPMEIRSFMKSVKVKKI